MDTPETWQGNAFCPDCDTIYKKPIPFGKTVEEYLEETNLCKWCGNSNLIPVVKKKHSVPLS